MPVVVEKSGSWSWTVATRYQMMPKQGLRVIVTGEHVGTLPVTGQHVLIRAGDHVVRATVDFLMRSEKREGETVTGSTGQPAAHPLLAAEGAAQKRIAAFMRQLGWFSEEKRDRPGRPPKPFGGY